MINKIPKFIRTPMGNIIRLDSIRKIEELSITDNNINFDIFYCGIGGDSYERFNYEIESLQFKAKLIDKVRNIKKRIELMLNDGDEILEII